LLASARLPWGRTAQAWLLFGIAAATLAALAVKPAAAQDNMGQILTPFSTSTMPQPFAGPGSGGQDGGGHHGDHGGHFRHHGFPIFITPFPGGFIDDGGVASIQSNPVNPAPFAPSAPPTANDRAPTPPYKAPSVEVAPGGIEIVRGPG
jgi:hypothetical protein